MKLSHGPLSASLAPRADPHPNDFQDLAEDKLREDARGRGGSAYEGKQGAHKVRRQVVHILEVRHICGRLEATINGHHDGRQDEAHAGNHEKEEHTGRNNVRWERGETG